ncbi:MAG: metalloregulator ArsR/SmtB family transcription factor [Candidatus Moranbacteria bacterium]|nr:metalloregulator ArsR/SmtB family transcription factor [Candidatus Moranbacteria bacterium]
MISIHTQIFKALADETRLQIVAFLAKRKGGSCGEISTYFDTLSQPTLSHHFKILADAGIITVEKRSVSRYYTLNKKYLKTFGVEADKLNSKEA